MLPRLLNWQDFTETRKSFFSGSIQCFRPLWAHLHVHKASIRRGWWRALPCGGPCILHPLGEGFGEAFVLPCYLKAWGCGLLSTWCEHGWDMGSVRPELQPLVIVGSFSELKGRENADKGFKRHWPSFQDVNFFLDVPLWIMFFFFNTTLWTLQSGRQSWKGRNSRHIIFFLLLLRSSLTLVGKWQLWKQVMKGKHTNQHRD